MKRFSFVVVLAFVFILSSCNITFTKNPVKKEFDTLKDALEDYYVNTTGIEYNNITIENVDEDLKMVLLYTDNKKNQKGKRFYGVRNYEITNEGKVVLGNVNNELGLETQSKTPSKWIHKVEGIGYVYQFLLYNNDIEMESVELLLENGDIIEKSTSNNNVFIPISEYRGMEELELEDIEHMIESVTIYDSNNKIIWSNKN